MYAARVCVCVCTDVFADMSGDICCVAGRELSTVGPQEPQTKEMKAEVATRTSGTRHQRSGRTNTKSHMQRHKHKLSAQDIHTTTICLSHMKNVEGVEDKTRKDKH